MHYYDITLLVFFDPYVIWLWVCDTLHIECVCCPIHSHTNIYIFSMGGPKLTYVARTIRLPVQVANQVRELAHFFGWELADFARTLLCIGAVFFFLSYGSHHREEAATTLLGGLKLLRLSRSFTLNFSERPYALRLPGHKSILMTLSLPKSISEIVADYAALMKASRNETYSKFLQQGLLVYLKAQTAILQASE